MLVIEDKEEFKSLIREAVREELEAQHKPEEEIWSITECQMFIGCSAPHFNKIYRPRLKSVGQGKHPRFLKTDVLALLEQMKSEGGVPTLQKKRAA